MHLLEEELARGATRPKRRRSVILQFLLFGGLLALGGIGFFLILPRMLAPSVYVDFRSGSIPAYVSFGSMITAHGVVRDGDALALQISGSGDLAYSAGGTLQKAMTLDLGAGYEANFSGHRIEVKVTARSAKPSGQKFAMSYSTNDVGNSGWRVFDLSSEFKTFSFRYYIARKVRGSGDYLGIMPSVGGGQEAVTISDISVSRL